ncbi:MAG TPA: hypothetical protein ENK02_02005 [Planctomycetes bacterium]|nr:hypothetical protein [Planctomycetota bacterium]
MSEAQSTISQQKECILAWFTKTFFLFVGLVGSWTILPAQATWSPDKSGFAFINNSGMANDFSRGEVVVFGGEYESTASFADSLYASTWVWNGRRWRRFVDPKGPMNWMAGGMVYDFARKQVMMIGGAIFERTLKGLPRNNPLLSRQHWVWTGRRWKALPSFPGKGRRDFGIATDPKKKKVILFGGNLSPSVWMLPSNETWEWDGKRWTQKFPLHVPKARVSPRMTYDPQTGTCLMYGGYEYSKDLKDLWAWNGNDWVLLDKGTKGLNPGRRIFFAFSPIPGKKGVYLWGGFDPNNNSNKNLWFHDAWKWNGSQWVLLKTKAPYYSGLNGQALMPGGPAALFLAESQDTGRIPHFGVRETWAFNGDFFVKVRGAPDYPWFDWNAKNPSPISLVVDTKRDQLILFGGSPYGNTPSRIWVKKGEKVWAPKIIGMLPNIGMNWFNRSSSLVYHETLGLAMLHFNGVNGWVTWLWDGVAWKEDRSLKKPQNSQLIYDPVRKRILAFDRPNFNYGNCTNYNTWEWSPKVGWKVIRQGQKVCLRGVFVWDPVRDRLINFYRERIKGVPTPFLREWDGKTWKLMPGKFAPPFEASKAFFHPSLGGVVFVGGEFFDPTGRPYLKTWLWDGKSGSEISSAQLKFPNDHQFEHLNWVAYNPARNQAIGLLNEYPGGTPLWVFRLNSLKTTEPYPHLQETFQLQVDLPRRAGDLFLFFFSFSHRPGIPVFHQPFYGDRLLPLAPDVLFQASLGFGLRTVLNAKGQGSISMAFSKDPRFLGLEVYASGVSFNGQGITDASDEVLLRLVK